MKKKVSVIIPVYNGEKYISDAIESALNQTYQNFELIVIDDGSTDKTKQILKTYWENIKYIYQKNQGPAVARNTGIKASDGEFIAFLDSDDIWKKNKLKSEVKVLNKNPDISLVHANDVKISIDKKTLDGYTRNKKNLDGYLAKRLIMRKIHIQICTVLMRRECIKKCGLFDPNLSKLGAEDREFFYRVTQKCKAKYIDKDVSYYRVTPNSVSANREKMLKGHLYILDKHFPPKKWSLNLNRRLVLSTLYFEEGKRISWESTNYRLGINKYFIAARYFPFNITVYFHIFKNIIKIVVSFLNFEDNR